ncbi:hypothetical protein [Niabella drilacis]|uniref:Uncharacterized protein n=1 Tax=Niabella drilacis (strain DSM 25811 / CCM 8410 / CCUG 62505 / LMG 26954 / E90) TaxID=1285928 RepID=A0A1G6Z2A2_NIADE|nr:hypothetical protein [Niabella drilacis]SDD96423.1 hypothetical protein SAMN04487894_11719 [Niabella drilacis]
MKRNRRYAYFFPWVLLLIPLLMWLFWLLTPKKQLVVAIVDKTVLTTEGQEHISLTWILNHYRFTKDARHLYHVGSDYFGFFPKKNEQFRLKGLERFDASLLDKLSNDADLAYYTDAYGVFSNEWYLKKNIGERSRTVYGGLSMQDVDFMEKMKQKRKLVLAEFNTIGSPSAVSERYRFEQLFGLKWTGWIGRYFGQLDTAENKDIPHWLVKGYMDRHNNSWPFKDEGIVFVGAGNTIVVLEGGKDLVSPLPYIVTEKAFREHYHLPEKVNYSYWFDVVTPDTAMNRINARFALDLTDAGKEILRRYGIPLSFPAVQSHKGTDYQFWYFSGDFCDNPISFNTSYFKGIEFFSFLFMNRLDKTQRKSFFWSFYRPLVSTILKEYYADKKESGR